MHQDSVEEVSSDVKPAEHRQDLDKLSCGMAFFAWARMHFQQDQVASDEPAAEAAAEAGSKDGLDTMRHGAIIDVFEHCVGFCQDNTVASPTTEAAGPKEHSNVYQFCWCDHEFALGKHRRQGPCSLCQIEGVVGQVIS